MELSDLQLIIISSPSGAGKTTLTRRALDAFPDLTFSISHTTRAPRGSERDGSTTTSLTSPSLKGSAMKAPSLNTRACTATSTGRQ